MIVCEWDRFLWLYYVSDTRSANQYPGLSLAGFVQGTL